jgi:hypothetical protein
MVINELSRGITLPLPDYITVSNGRIIRELEKKKVVTAISRLPPWHLPQSEKPVSWTRTELSSSEIEV